MSIDYEISSPRTLKKSSKKSFDLEDNFGYLNPSFKDFSPKKQQQFFNSKKSSPVHSDNDNVTDDEKGNGNSDSETSNCDQFNHICGHSKMGSKETLLNCRNCSELPNEDTSCSFSKIIGSLSRQNSVDNHAVPKSTQDEDNTIEDHINYFYDRINDNRCKNGLAQQHNSKPNLSRVNKHETPANKVLAPNFEKCLTKNENFKSFVKNDQRIRSYHGEGNSKSEKHFSRSFSNLRFNSDPVKEDILKSRQNFEKNSKASNSKPESPPSIKNKADIMLDFLANYETMKQRTVSDPSVKKVDISKPTNLRVGAKSIQTVQPERIQIKYINSPKIGRIYTHSRSPLTLTKTTLSNFNKDTPLMYQRAVSLRGPSSNRRTIALPTFTREPLESETNFQRSFSDRIPREKVNLS